MDIRVNLSKKVAAWLERKARAAGADEAAVAARVLEQAADDELAHPNGHSAHSMASAEVAQSETLYDRARKAGLVGCLPGTPRDLSTNKDHFDGFGRD